MSFTENVQLQDIDLPHQTLQLKTDKSPAY